MQGSDLLIGGDGNDQFAYSSLTDAGDRITDFEVGRDHIVLTQLLDTLNYQGTDAIADKYILLASTGTGTMLEIGPDGPTGNGIFRPLLLVQNVSIAALNNPNNFVF